MGVSHLLLYRILPYITIGYIGYLDTHSLREYRWFTMAQGWEMLILFAGFSAALENTQALSQQCLMDTNTFLWEMNRTRPKDYAFQSM